MKPYLKQLKSILLHKWYFFKAGRYLGLPLWLCLAHDISKFVPVEFMNYARWFYGAKDKAGWASAWRHHAHHNKHHPEHWVLAWRGDPDFYNEIGESVAPFVTVLPMPALYVREMVADWMAASKTFTGSYDIAVWLNEHGRTMLLHNATITEIHRIMDTGDRWFCTDNCPFSFMASNEFRRWNGQSTA
jgi:hypothetical protein